MIAVLVALANQILYPEVHLNAARRTVCRARKSVAVFIVVASFGGKDAAQRALRAADAYRGRLRQLAATFCHPAFDAAYVELLHCRSTSLPITYS